MPQRLKHEIREKILSSALDSFLEKGFRDSSMQEIAQRAGIATGNIYHYFRNKDTLLSTLIEPVLKEVKGIFGVRIKDLPMLNMEEGMGISGKKMDAFIRVYQSNRKVFVLLFEKSDATKFDSTKADVIESLSAAIIRAKNTFTKTPATPEQEMLIRAFATAYISGIISILTSQTEEDLKLRVLQQFLPFMRTKLVNNLR